jgi:hypothetical protein
MSDTDLYFEVVKASWLDALHLWFIALSWIEVSAILLSLLGGVLYRKKTNSWQLLIRQIFLLPLLLLYSGYLSLSDYLMSTYLRVPLWAIVYYSTMAGAAGVAIWFWGIHWRSLAWAFFGKSDDVPVILEVGLQDIVWDATIAAAGFLLFYYCIGRNMLP